MKRELVMGRRLDVLENILWLLTKVKPNSNKLSAVFFVLWNSLVCKEDIFGDLAMMYSCS